MRLEGIVNNRITGYLAIGDNDPLIVRGVENGTEHLYFLDNTFRPGNLDCISDFVGTIPTIPLGGSSDPPHYQD